MRDPFIKVPFASSGDKSSIPQAAQPNGSISMQNGWGIDYEKEVGVDPAAKSVNRQDMNQILNLATSLLNRWQTESFPEWIDSAANGGSPYPYPAGVVVRYPNGSDFVLRYSLVSNNTQTPSATAATSQWSDPSIGLSIAKPLGAGVDLNSIQSLGFYSQPNDADAAGGQNYPAPYAGTLIVQEAGSLITSQFYIAAGDAWVRSRYNTTWTAWRPVVFGTRNITAGNGLTGGGNLSQDRAIALATPGTLNGTTTNSATPSGHWHAIDAASETVAGVSMLATQVIAEAGTDTARPLAALRVLQLIRATVSNATEALRGTLRVATQTEVNAGTDDTTSVTPKKLRAGFAANLSSTGYITFPTWMGGLIFQWGQVSGATSGTATATFPIAFNTAFHCNAFYSYSSDPGSITQQGGAVVYMLTNTTALFRFLTGFSSSRYLAWGV